MDKMKTKLAISNVAWYNNNIEEFITFISSLGCKGIELAASMIWDEPLDATYDERMDLRGKIKDAGLQLTGLQALLYTHQELALFKEERYRKEMLDYLTGMMDLCRDLGGQVLVFGSPRNRNIGKMPLEKAHSIAVEFFHELGMRALDRGLFFCIEPLGKVETDFINTVYEAERFIEEVEASKGLGLHIDTKGLIDEDEVNAPYLSESFSRAKHVHLNDPGLTAPGSSGYDHRLICKRIKGSNYSRFLSIEMRRVDSDVEGSIHKAVEYVKQVYFEGSI